MGRIANFNKAKTWQKKKKIFDTMFPGMRINALRNMDEATRNRIFKDYKGLERWYEANVEAGNLGVPHGNTFGAGQEAHDVAKLNNTKQQEDLRKNYADLAQKELGPMLEKLRTPYTHPVNKRMEEIFGHLQNPIMQGLFAQEQPRGSLFPSAIEQEYRQGPPMGYQESQQPSAIGDLLSALGGHAMKQYVDPWMKDQTAESLEKLYNQGMEQYGQPAYDYAKQGLGNAYDYGMNSRPGNALQYLGGIARHPIESFQNYADTGFSGIRNPETYGQSIQQILGTLMQPAAHPQQFAQGVGQMGSNLYNRMRGQQ